MRTSHFPMTMCSVGVAAPVNNAPNGSNNNPVLNIPLTLPCAMICFFDCGYDFINLNNRQARLNQELKNFWNIVTHISRNVLCLKYDISYLVSSLQYRKHSMSL